MGKLTTATQIANRGIGLKRKDATHNPSKILNNQVITLEPEGFPLPVNLTENEPKPNIGHVFYFLKRHVNKEYESGVKRVPLRSCLLHNNGAVFSHEWHVKTKPKWVTDLLQTDYDRNTGELLAQSVYRTDDLTSGNNRKIKAVNRFCEHFKDQYRKRKVSLFFYTFTLANQASTSIRDCFKAFKKRLKRRGINLRGYIWILEISDNLHVHYHALVATDRINFKGQSLPEFLKMDDVWGARCQVEAVRYSVRGYLSKYFVKNKSRILGKRQYGIMGVPKKQRENKEK